MRCPGCSAEVADGSRFCGRCGSAVVTPSSPTMTREADAPSDSSYSSGGPSLDESRFLPGTMIAGRYRVIGLLGKGGMGEVYRADDLKLGQAVALKFLPAELAGEPHRLARFLDEVKIARQVSHPNVCRVYDVGETEGHHYLSMEYVDGEDLATLLLRIGRLPHDKALQIARQLCAGLAAAHELGVLHRDIKPANVMLDGRGRAKLTDFGLARVAGELRGGELRAGTPVYMAPEQLAGREVSVRSDVYSLGLVLYEIFTGKQAFESTPSATRTGSRDVSTPTSPSSWVEGIDPAVERVILRCLENDPAQRPAGALAVAAALPGGDPLAAAIAAGETPSPEMVAAAGGAGALRLGVGIACLAFSLASFVLIAALHQRYGLVQAVGLPLSTEVLAAKGREILDEAGYGRGADRAWGFALREQALRNVMDEHPVDPWPALARARPSPLAFWYRESPVPLRPGRWDPNEGALVIEEDAPPWSVPGMAGVRLDPDGRLDLFYAVSPEWEGIDPSAPPPDWSAFFEHAGIDAETLRSVEPRWNPIVSRNPVAWEATPTGSAEGTVRVEAGSYNGRPVFFAVVPPWAGQEAAPGEVPGWLVTLAGALYLAALVGAAFMARHNLRLRRGDRRGAFRLAVALAATMLLSWLLRAHHVPDTGWFVILGLHLAWAVASGGIVWVIYMAIEPYVRRWWPEALVSWTRLLAGRLRDPRVGRDFLIGGAIFAAVTLWQLGAWVLPDWLGLPAPDPLSIDLASLLGTRQTAGQYVAELTTVLILPLFLMFILVVLRLITRRQWIAIILFALPWVALATLHPVPWIGALYVLGTFVAFTFTLVRFGVLPFAVILWLSTMDQGLVLTLDPAAWYVGRSIFSMLVFTAVLTYAFRISLGSRQALSHARGGGAVGSVASP